MNTTNSAIGTVESRVFHLSHLTTRTHSGLHFMSNPDYPHDVLDDLEGEGLIAINRPVHAATGIPYSEEYWSVEVTEDGQELVDDHPEYHDSRSCG